MFNITQDEIDEAQKFANKKDYGLYLQSSYWKKLAEEVREMAGRRCQLCNSGYRTNIHHRDYSNVGDPEKEIKDLVCLCDICHSIYHKHKDGITIKYNFSTKKKKKRKLNKQQKKHNALKNKREARRNKWTKTAKKGYEELRGYIAEEMEKLKNDKTIVKYDNSKFTNSSKL